MGIWRTPRPRLTSTHARESTRVLKYMGQGLTAYARQPKGVGVRQPARAIEGIDCMYDGKVLKPSRRAAADERKACLKLRDGSDGALDHAVELTDVRRARGVLHTLLREKLGKLVGKELAHVVAV
eukprot:2282592-Pleurochrysis_carterae.AAC.4